MEKINLDGKEIKTGMCSTLTCRIMLKQFCYLSAHEMCKEDNDVSLTEDSIMRWLNESDSFDYRNGILTIQTTNYTIYVVVDASKEVSQ